MMKYLFILLFVVGCGNATKSDNPPSVAGTYQCISGCSGICLYETTIVTQHKSNVFVDAHSFASCPGSINNNGDFTSKCKDYFGDKIQCSGTFHDDLFTLDCTLGGIRCQQVLFVTI